MTSDAIDLDAWPQGQFLDDAQFDALRERLRHHLENAGTLGDWVGASKGDLEAMYVLAWRLSELGRHKEALIHLRKLATLNPYERRYMQALASCLHTLGDYEEALLNYFMMIVLDADDMGPTFHMAQCLLRMGQPEPAKDCLELFIDGATGKPQWAELMEQAQAMRQLLATRLTQTQEAP